MNNALQRLRAARDGEHGFTLVETIIAATIFLLVMTMVTFVIKEATSSYGASTQRTDASILANNDLATAFTYNCGMETGVNTTSTTQQSPVFVTSLTSGLTSGATYTSLNVAFINGTNGISQGTILTLVSGVYTQNVTVSQAAAQGATQISVTSFVANYSYPSGATVNTPSQTAYQPGITSQSQVLTNCGSLYNYPASADMTLGDPLPYTTNYNNYTYQVSYTSAWTTGTSGTYSQCPTGTTSVTPTGQIRNILITWGSNLALLANPLTAGTATTTLSVGAISSAVSVGSILVLSNGTNAQYVTVSAAAASGSTSITVNSFIPAYSYAAGSNVVLEQSSFPGPTAWSVSLASSVNSGSSPPTITVGAIPAPLTSGSILYVSNANGVGNKLTVLTNAAAGATTLSVSWSSPAVSSYASGSSFVSPSSQANSPLPLSQFASIPSSQVIYNNATDGQLELTGMAQGSYVVMSMPGWAPVRRFATAGGCAWFPFLPPNSQNPNSPAGPTLTYYSSVGATGVVVSTNAPVVTKGLEQCSVSGGCS